MMAVQAGAYARARQHLPLAPWHPIPQRRLRNSTGFPGRAQHSLQVLCSRLYNPLISAFEATFARFSAKANRCNARQFG